MARRPVIGLTTCVKFLHNAEALPAYATAQPYVAAVAVAARALPLLIPALGDGLDQETLLDRIDGLLLTGSLSNVHPNLYGDTDSEPCPPFDAARDATTLPLIRAAIARDLPILAICRGVQELNVALGGSLFPRVHQVTGRLDHRSDPAQSIDDQFSPAHAVALTFGGRLHALAGTERLMVNSLHSQGIDRLAPGLCVEATAPDGQIEAVRVSGARFALGLQWHPEWTATSDPFSRALFAAFGAAAQG
jgi:putative glutamine amidotransferase